MKTNANDAAFQKEKWMTSAVPNMPPEQFGGLTKREMFAAFAMQGLLAAVYSSTEMLNEFTLDESKFRRHLTGCVAVSTCAVNYADALIAALNEGKEDAK